MRATASAEAIATEKLRHEYNELQHNASLQVHVSEALSTERESWLNKLREVSEAHRQELVRNI